MLWGEDEDLQTDDARGERNGCGWYPSEERRCHGTMEDMDRRSLLGTDLSMSPSEVDRATRCGSEEEDAWQWRRGVRIRKQAHRLPTTKTDSVT